MESYCATSKQRSNYVLISARSWPGSGRPPRPTHTNPTQNQQGGCHHVSTQLSKLISIVTYCYLLIHCAWPFIPSYFEVIGSNRPCEEVPGPIVWYGLVLSIRAAGLELAVSFEPPGWPAAACYILLLCCCCCLLSFPQDLLPAQAPGLFCPLLAVPR